MYIVGLILGTAAILVALYAQHRVASSHFHNGAKKLTLSVFGGFILCVAVTANAYAHKLMGTGAQIFFAAVMLFLVAAAIERSNDRFSRYRKRYGNHFRG